MYVILNIVALAEVINCVYVKFDVIKVESPKYYLKILDNKLVNKIKAQKGH